VILRLETPPDPGPDLEGLILEETSYGTPPVAGPPSPSITLVLDGLLVETTDPEVTPVPPLAVAIHAANGTGLLRRSGVPGVTRCFEMRLSGGWASRLRESGFAGRGPSAYFNAGRINTLMAQIHVEAVRPGVASSMAISGLTLTLLAELGRVAATDTAGRPMQPWLRRAVALVHQRYREPLRMGELAREVGVHPVHLSRAFRRAFGVTMTEYVRDLRIHVAAEALVAGPDPLPRIARSVGYHNLGHFTRSFKRATGMTPGAYRGRRKR
jgi:AraC-like DNA-binding protein